MDQKKIGKFIAECRKNKKMTQQELADKLSVSNRTISNWENGKYLPDYSVLIPLTEVLEITIVELIYGEKQKTEEKTNVDYLNKIFSYISFKQKVDVEQCKKTGRLIFYGGMLVYLFSLFILTNREPAYYRIFTLIGGALAVLGFTYMNKSREKKKGLILNILSIVIFIFSFSVYDYINMTIFNKGPKFYYRCSYQGGSEYCKTLLFDSYRCVTNGDKYHITYKGKVDTFGNTVDVFDFCD